jgi:hypothetical protein
MRVMMSSETELSSRGPSSDSMRWSMNTRFESKNIEMGAKVMRKALTERKEVRVAYTRQHVMVCAAPGPLWLWFSDSGLLGNPNR